MQYKTFLLASLCFLLLACSGSESTSQPVRAIKTITVTESSGGQIRRLSGVVESAKKAKLSFEVPGRVNDVAVKLGDQVAEGMRLAALDPRPFQLNVDAAKAELTKAEAQLTDKQLDYEAKSKLYEDRFVSKTVVDTAYADYQAALQNAESAKAKLALAERDLQNSTLTAPFAGEIGNMDIDVGENIALGQTVMELVGQGGYEVAFLLPEALRDKVGLGHKVVVTFPTRLGTKFEGVITEIAARTQDTNAFPSKIQLDATQGLYPGLSAEVIINTQPGDDTLAYLIPLTAVAPKEGPEDGFVFIYDEQTQTVKKTPIKARAVVNHSVEVVEGVSPGDIVAVAGVHFLSDGQKVTLLNTNESP